MDKNKKIRYLENKIEHLERNLRITIPVYHGDKILLVKLEMKTCAVFNLDLKGKVIAQCDDADNATYILDFIN